MTFATKITVTRLCLVPVFAFLAIMYGMTAGSGTPVEAYRWAAFGAFLDPIADKALVLTAILILTFFQWGPDGWRIPYWFAALVILRDCVILAGIRVMWSAKRKVEFRPHWTGKICTFSLFLVLGWVMLRVTTIPPIYPSTVAAVFITWSMLAYIRQGLRILRA